MSPLATWVLAVLASSALAAPSQMFKRADTNTDTNIHLICGSQDIPNPVAGTGTGSASDQLYISAQGQKGSGQNCSQDPNDGNLNTCTFPASYGFKSDIVVRYSTTDCSMSFSYNGHDYDSHSDGQCTSNESFQAFGQETDTICYFNA